MGERMKRALIVGAGVSTMFAVITYAVIAFIAWNPAPFPWPVIRVGFVGWVVCAIIVAIEEYDA